MPPGLMNGKRRRRTRPDALFGAPYSCLGDFAGGIYDCDDHVSPWSKSAQNVDATIMVVGQDGRQKIM
jgi:hypothetical protein